MTKIIATLCLGAISIVAVEVSDIQVNFTAFKTYGKISVGGSFDTTTIVYQERNATQSMKMLENLEVNISTASVNSANKERDMKIVKNFFETQGVKSIEAHIVKVTPESLTAKIEMNQKAVEIPMSYTDSNGTIEAKGVIDLGDYLMLPSLKTLNTACYDLHQGKTWQDVNIGFTIHYK
ncbi:MAG: hypothetical protein KU29_14275 [Sulfurovum sp. FS06-10]|jgi:hypothetical protein|nr:MAG: hypothetical protein KU29_14275 [Sulfurovum sp. FS06-10]